MHQPLDANVKFIRMNTGEDLLAEIVNNNEKYILINPLKVVYLLGERPGSMMLSLIEWIFPRVCSEQKFEITSSNVLTIADPSIDIVDYYYDALGRMDNSDFKLDTDHDTIVKMRKQLDKEKKKEMANEMSEDDFDIFTQVMEGMKTSKRKLN